MKFIIVVFLGSLLVICTQSSYVYEPSSVGNLQPDYSAKNAKQQNELFANYFFNFSQPEVKYNRPHKTECSTKCCKCKPAWKHGKKVNK